MNWPRSLAVASKWAWVFTFRAEILALAMTAPLGSCTVPSIRAADWANNAAVVRNTMLKSAANRRTVLQPVRRTLCMLPPGQAFLICPDGKALRATLGVVAGASKGTRSLLVPKRENDVRM